ncbi:hypothetical protein ACM66B_003705 [Microbotryomycetes sp. NB124-2]
MATQASLRPAAPVVGTPVTPAAGSTPPPTWGGDGTLHAYCYDYLLKRGWTQTASSFAQDAGIDEAGWTGPPIEAPQGLLYEWWAVFWDVFVARSQRATNRNAHADTYVEAIRAKRDPLTINFAGPNAPAPITMPRSLPVNARGPAVSMSGPRVTHTHPGQLHVLEQQQLQQQMQAGRPPVALARPGNNPGSFAQGPAQMHMQPMGGPSQMPPGQPSSASPFAGQPTMYPQGPGSAQSSPRVQPAPHPLANGRGPPVMSTQGQQPASRLPPPVHEVLPGSSGQGPLAGAFAQSMAAVGLSGRDPESLNVDEQNAVAAQMRRVGALPPLPPGQHPMRAPPARVMPQRIPSDSMLPQSARFQGGPGAPSPQTMQQQQREQLALQQRMQQQGQMPPQMQYASSQMGSPASPAYSAPSPFTTPHAQHINLSAAPANQASPGGNFPPPPPQQQPQKPPSRAGNKSQAATNKMSPAANTPANAKRAQGGANADELGPRSRKRARGATAKEEESEGVMGPPETPGFDSSSSPAMGMGPQPYPTQGVPYASNQDPSARGAMDAMQISHNQRLALQHQQQGLPPPPQPGMPGNDGNGAYSMQMNGDMGHVGTGPHSNGAPNGRISRPDSAASNFLQMPPTNNHNQNASAGQPTFSPNGPGPQQLAGSPHLSLQIPSSAPPGSSPVNVSPGGTVRPFAGAAASPLQPGRAVPLSGGGGPSPVHPSIVPLPPGPGGGGGQAQNAGGFHQQQQQSRDVNHYPGEQKPSVNGDSSVVQNGNSGGDGSARSLPPAAAAGMTEDMYADLSLDFAFDDFVNDGLFPDDPTQGGDGPS